MSNTVEIADSVGPFRVRIGYWMNTGWEWFLKDIGMHLLIGLIAAIFLHVGTIFLMGPVYAGMAVAGLRMARSQRTEVQDFLDGFRYFLAAFLSSLLIFVFVVVGLIFLIVPGLVITAMYLFTFHFIVDRHQDFWQAMESSRKVVSRDYFGFTLFVVLLGIINALGLAFFWVGILLTLPVSYLATTAAYLDVLGTEPALLSDSPPPPPVHIE
ncbi:MAG: hypothetical protein ACRD1R_12965 [Acidobacteriota bacterium]